MTDLETILSAAADAAPHYAVTAPRQRALTLVTIADHLDAAADTLVALAEEETCLTEARLRGELKRTTWQLRLFAEVVVEGAYLDARIDQADPEYVIGPRPDVRRVNVPLGPVLNFAASNFPFAFSVAGGDTAAALAAGCPVIVKAHDGHPRLSSATAKIICTALAESGQPEGVFALIAERDHAMTALRDDRIRAGTFTGSTQVGLMLAEVAAARARPIPFYGELGSVNPVFVTPAAMHADAERIGREYAQSVAGSAGQLCTKPGFCFVPEVEPLRGPVVAAMSEVTPSRLLTSSISEGYVNRRAAILSESGAQVMVNGEVRRDEDGYAWVTPTVVTMGLAELERADHAVLDEAFGPLSVLVRYDDVGTLATVAERIFPGNLTATVLAAEDEDPCVLEPLVAALGRVAGRVIFGGWPTGVSVTAAMQHGGPYPATTTDATSVGTAALGRFLRGVAFQGVPDALLPSSLRDDNPWDVPQRRSAAGQSSKWGQLTGRY